MITRTDMTDWVIHFVHRRDPENDAIIYDDDGQDFTIPYQINDDKEVRFDLWKIKDREKEFEPDADALTVLCRILDDGHIRSGWSFRNGRATIYGPRSACCFTEMPLHALLRYARERNDDNLVDCYGIALLKSELFAAGGRHAIYGVSTSHVENGRDVWPRTLAPASGIGEHEQYRYVATNIGGNPYIDWTHEREWRWSDVQDFCNCPGLPVWLDQEPISFTAPAVIVRTLAESERVLDKLKEMRDSRSDNYGNPYKRAAVENTRVFVLDEILTQTPRSLAGVLRIDDIPAHQLKQVVVTQPSRELLEQITQALVIARAAAARASEQWRLQNNALPFGFAHLMVDTPRSPTVEAMIQLGVATAIGGVGYSVSGITDMCRTGLLGEAEAAATAAARELTECLPDVTFWVRTRWD